MTELGFSSTTDDVLDGVDLSGRLAVVTGASTGLGEETTRALAAHGAEVVMAVRDVDRGNAAADRVRASVGGAALSVAQLDLGSLASVRSFADGFLAEHDQLHLLINNAGIMACPQGATQDGFELQFGTNHLGRFLLGTLLTPALINGAPSRLISLSSRGHAFADVDLNDPGFARTPYEPFSAYGRSKTANALFALSFEHRHAADGVHAYSVHPGGIHTELGRHMTEDTINTLRQRMTNEGRTFYWKTIPREQRPPCGVQRPTGSTARTSRTAASPRSTPIGTSSAACAHTLRTSTTPRLCGRCRSASSLPEARAVPRNRPHRTSCC